jgi:outer membrane protein OmpA-like peptidoglycan-associated protein
MSSRKNRQLQVHVALIAAAGLASGCALFQQGEGPERTTSRDKTAKGAGIGAASGAVLGAVLGEGEADEILAGAAIGAGIGAGVGAYMDRQEEQLARIPGTTVERVGKDTLLIHFDADLLFAVDSATLSDSARSSLEDVAAVLDEYPKTAVVIQGHTDATGSEEHNQSLSDRRARAVQNYLAGRGVDTGRMTSIGYGEGEPIAGNDTASGRQRNRRVNLLLKAKAV